MSAWNVPLNTATSIVDYLIEQSDNSLYHEKISSKLFYSLKNKSDSIIESIEAD